MVSSFFLFLCTGAGEVHIESVSPQIKGVWGRNSSVVEHQTHD